MREKLVVGQESNESLISDKGYLTGTQRRVLVPYYLVHLRCNTITCTKYSLHVFLTEAPYTILLVPKIYGCLTTNIPV
jgi:hypothetical protein